MKCFLCLKLQNEEEMQQKKNIHDFFFFLSLTDDSGDILKEMEDDNHSNTNADMLSNIKITSICALYIF